MNISNLHPHQKKAIEKVLQSIEDGSKRINIAMPSGTGKAVVVTTVVNDFLNIRSQSGKSLVITRTIEEQYQLTDIFKQIDISLNINLEIKQEAPATEVTILTLSALSKHETNTRLIALKPFDMIVFMGGGLSAPILEEVFHKYPEAIQFVITDRPEITERFGNPVAVYTLKNAIEEGLSFTPYRVKEIEVLPEDLRQDLSQFSHEGTEILLEFSKSHLKDAAKRLLQEIGADKTLVYCPNVAFAEEFAEIVNDQAENGTYTVAISASMSMDQQIKTFRSYKNSAGEPFILCLVAPNISGTDMAVTRSIAIFSKTSSASLLQNMIISGLKPYKGKRELQVLDFVGLQDLFSEIDDQDVAVGEFAVVEEIPENTTNEVHEYFKKSNIFFRDKREIEGVLGVDDLAEELAEIVSMMPAEQGSMIGIFGKWGRGKTFLMEQTWKKLEAKGTFIKVEFHAWKYQDTPATWAYLYECLSDVYVKPEFEWKPRTWPERIRRLTLLNYKRKGIFPIFKFFAILFAGIVIPVLSSKLLFQNESRLNTWFDVAGISLTTCLTIYALFRSIKKEYGAKAKDLFLKYSTKHSFKEHLGLQAEIQKETLTLLKVWISEAQLKKQKIVLFVEDIDRCSEGKIIQIIDSLRVLLEDTEIAKRVIVVAAVDERMLKLAIKMKYHSLIALEKKDDLHARALSKVTDEYIDKLFIAGLKLGDLSSNDSDEFLIALTKPDREQESVSGLQSLLDEEARQINARHSQHIQDALLDYEIEQMQSQDDLMEYQEAEYAIEYLKNSTGLSDVQQETGPVVVVDGISKTLSNDEIDILRVSITKFHGATPRQIRIYYYRYLIAKNLLIRRYQTLKKTNVWQTKSNCRILSTLIILYTLHEEEGILNKHLEGALKDTRENHYVQLMSETMVSGFDYRELLKVLSVVIAY